VATREDAGGIVLLPASIGQWRGCFDNPATGPCAVLSIEEFPRGMNNRAEDQEALGSGLRTPSGDSWLEL